MKIDNVTSETKDRKVLLSDINLKFKETDFIAVIGSSGAGKTSLINLILKDSNFKNGYISFQGKKIVSKKDKKVFLKNVSLLSQNPNLIYDDSVFDNLKRFVKDNSKWYLKIVNYFTLKKANEILKVLKKLGINDYIFSLVKELSGGQIQRVEIAKNLLIKKQIILADEPTSNLDFKNAENVLYLLKEIATENKSLTLVNIHDVGLIENELFNRVIGIKNGKIVFDKKTITKEEIKQIYE
ncbi:ATP-binding cassette domain-containing protein [Mycoplasma testudineum]|uniref:ATP-binding cassette domain-containing protein n=1 Tax=Mycoplasma testudineum TaxID=244584 RepID=UPI0014151C97|nr:ATP-binding cassette domain-containing protein [Mycoplasma testudineum]